MDAMMKITFNCGVEYKESLFLCAQNINAIFRYDMKDKKLFLITLIQDSVDGALFRRAFVYKNKVWFVPESANNMVILNIDDYEVEYISLPGQKIESKMQVNYISAGIYKDKYLYLVPFEMDTAVIIDMESETIIANYKIADKAYLYSNAIYKDEYLYFFPWKGKDILKLDIKEHKKINIPFEHSCFTPAIYDKECEECWHMPVNESCLVVGDIEGQQVEKISYPNSAENDCGKFPFYYGKVLNEKIFFLPYESREILAVHKTLRKMERYSIARERIPKRLFRLIDSERLMALVDNSNLLVIYDDVNDCWKVEEIELSKEEFAAGTKRILQNTKCGKVSMFQKEEFINLKDFIDFVIEKDKEVGDAEPRCF